MTHQTSMQRLTVSVRSCSKCRVRKCPAKRQHGFCIIEGRHLDAFHIGVLERLEKESLDEWCIIEERKEWYEELEKEPTQ